MKLHTIARNTITRTIKFIACLLLSITPGIILAQDMPAACEQNCPAPYIKNEFWTTEYGTAAANIVLSPANFLSCSSSAYALCYYSGPNGTTTGIEGKTLPALPCKVSKKDPGYADCRCYAETGNSYVDINAISNTEAYIETVRICGTDGSRCRNMVTDAADKLAQKIGAPGSSLPTAPVCSYLQAGDNGFTPMAPASELISTFSFAEAKHYGTTTNSCTDTPALYAGCMTASCKFEVDNNKNKTGFAICKCPTYTGPFQIGPTDFSCDLGGNNLWSASYTPPVLQQAKQ